ncbi:alkaline phosphatase D family protein [Streptomyces cavernicola]|uniref:Alkaline phosphatase D family protein n=1 Tax=Streptomyces cavernicola TaxID=3043613 RepID=A0ABT6SCG6_9ACTN|nr:alkaline phosphatase D family protein [Streptomyces sp. B-S-A6]MDI3405883.1 alkaline phosphatase D family protein [Streptomyces sp. B-S-A6]
MAELRLGPLLRYVDGSTATVWVESDRPSTAEVRCADGAKGSTHTFRIAGHHYALIPVEGLAPGTETAYEVLLDGHRVWPLEDSPFPPSTIRTPAEADGSAEVRVSFGSCRWAISPTGEKDPMGPDALDTLAVRLAADPRTPRPDVLVLLGDQVYADMVSPATKQWLAERRDLSDPPPSSQLRSSRAVPPREEVADYEEYAHLYDESWLDPEVRWLLSTVPSCMIFDDHDVIDDWNTSAAWLTEMRATPWWNERVLSGLMSYWVYQHLGNLPPAELAADPVYAAVRASADGTDALRAFAARADADPASARWSYRRDFGRVRLLMVDTRAARVLDESHRAMLDADEARWLREQALDAPGSYDHLLIGTSLPWLLPHLVHDAEGWNAALARGERGPRWARFAEDLRRRSDLEHWPAFPESFAQLTDLIAEAGSGPDAPASVCVLSGDVHHAYVAEPTWPRGEGPQPDVRVLQLTCSPMHNSIHPAIRLGFRFGWSRAGRALGRRFARHGRTAPAKVDWRRTGGPWFGNHLMTLTLRGRSGELALDRARATGGGTAARLERVQDSVIST